MLSYFTKVTSNFLGTLAGDTLRCPTNVCYCDALLENSNLKPSLHIWFPHWVAIFDYLPWFCSIKVLYLLQTHFPIVVNCRKKCIFYRIRCLSTSSNRDEDYLAIIIIFSFQFLILLFASPD